MRYIVLSILFCVLFCGAAFAQPTNAPPAWNVTLAPNTTAQSSLSVVNQCRRKHNFEIQKQNVPFFNVSQNQVQAGGGQTVSLPVQFNTQNMAVGAYQGQVLVVCLTCRNEPNCMQDREVLQVVLNVAPPNQPNNQPNPNQNPPTQNQPNPTNQPNPPVNQPANNPTNQSQPDWWTKIPKDKIPRVTSVYNDFLSGGVCSEQDCEKLRQIAAEKEAAANDAQSQANNAKKKAADAENDAKKAAQAAQPNPEGGTITADGDTFSQADSDFLEGKKKKLFDDWQAGRITAEEHQRQRQELSGPDALKKAREERLAKEAELKKEAEKAKVDAEKAKAESNAAQKKADEAKKEAAAALEEYKKCLKAEEEECKRQAEAKAKAEKEQKEKDAKAAAEREKAEKARQEEENRAKAAREREELRRAEVEYLLDNIKRLGLISSSPFKDIPGAFDAVVDKIIPDILGKTAEQWVSEMTQQAAEGVSGSPIPISSIQAIGGLYQVAAALLDPCTQAGMARTVERLQEMVNPKTGRKYTLNEALDKTEKMCELLKELKSKVEKIKKLQEQKTK